MSFNTKVFYFSSFLLTIGLLPFPSITLAQPSAEEVVTTDPVPKVKKADPEATRLFELGETLLDTNRKEAIDAYISATKLGSNAATKKILYLAALYINGTEVEQNYPLAIELLKAAAFVGNVKAEITLAKAYEAGYFGLEKNRETASNYFHWAASHGSVEAQKIMAHKYYNGTGIFGNGVSKSYKYAFEMFKMAAEQGDADSQYNVGLMYHKGEGIRQDLKEAMRWYYKASEQGNLKARKLYTKIGYHFAKIRHQNFESATDRVNRLARESQWKKNKDTVAAAIAVGAAIIALSPNTAQPSTSSEQVLPFDNLDVNLLWVE